MNLRTPPKTGNAILDAWLLELHRFLEFPAFPCVNLTPRASVTDTTEGNIYYDSDDDKLKVKAAAGWEDCN